MGSAERASLFRDAQPLGLGANSGKEHPTGVTLLEWNGLMPDSIQPSNTARASTRDHL
jgi:hypothetical protein